MNEFPEPRSEPVGGHAAFLEPSDYPTIKEIANAKPVTVHHHALLCYREDEKYYFCYSPWNRPPNLDIVKLTKSVVGPL